MKNLVVLLLLLLCISSYAQDAASYFPANPGYTWNFEIVPLDSVSNQIDSLKYYQVDSFAVSQQSYMGMPANIIVSKVKYSSELPFSPYLDSTFVSFNNSDAYGYYELFNIDSLINSSSSSNVLSKTKSVNETKGWLDFYRFAQTENSQYQIFLLDTNVTYKGLNLQTRFEINGTRIADQSINTDAGNFDCKKFVIGYTISVLIIGYTPVFNISDTVWIAPGYWIVKDYTPSVIENPLGLGEIIIPGSKKVIIPQIPTGVNEVQAKVNDFKLYQNYPNPFNPSTIIRYSLPENSNVELTIYDILGNKVTTLINEEKPAGTYEVTWNAANLPSGVYFYQIKEGSYTATKKLLLLK